MENEVTNQEYLLIRERMQKSRELKDKDIIDLKVTYEGDRKHVSIFVDGITVPLHSYFECK